MNREAIVESACEVMHDAYEAAAVREGWETQDRSRKPWADVPEANKATMRAAVAALLNWALPQVSTVEELEALPKGSKLLGADGSTWQRNHVGSWISDGHLTRRSERLVTIKKVAPLTVVWQQ